MKGRKILGTALVVVLLCVAAWFFFNYAYTLRMPADQAAIEIAKRFETSSSGLYSARRVDSVTDVELGRQKSVFLVSRPIPGIGLAGVRVRTN